MNPQTKTMEEQFKEAVATLPNSTTLMAACCKSWDGSVTLDFSVHFRAGESVRFQTFEALLKQIAHPEDIARKAAMDRVDELKKQIQEITGSLPCV